MAGDGPLGRRGHYGSLNHTSANDAHLASASVRWYSCNMLPLPSYATLPQDGDGLLEMFLPDVQSVRTCGSYVSSVETAATH